MTGESIGQLFIAGILPGIMLASLFMGYIAVRVIIRSELAPPFEEMPWKQRTLSIIGMWPIGVIMFIVLGGIYLGVMTPTEAAAVGAVTALVFALAYRQLNWQIMKRCLRDTTKLCSWYLALSY